MKHIDPINKKEIEVKSVYIPTKTLLQGFAYSQHPRCLVPRQMELPFKGIKDETK